MRFSLACVSTAPMEVSTPNGQTSANYILVEVGQND
jgi:hypothetical protein